MAYIVEFEIPHETGKADPEFFERWIKRPQTIRLSPNVKRRLGAGLPALRERIVVAQFIQEIQASAAMEAQNSGHGFTVHPVDHRIEVDADRQMLASAASNLLQNAFKFTKPQGNVSLKVHATNGRVLIEIEDECGGLPPGKAEELFRPVEQRGDNRTDLGLGLSISYRAVAQSGGKLSVRNLSSTGCVFTIDLPKRGP